MSNKPHETAASHETQTHHETHAHHGAKTPADAPPKNVLTEGTGGQSVVRFTLNGQTKSLNRPVTGAELYRLSGGAQKLTVDGKTIANDSEPVELVADAAILAVY